MNETHDLPHQVVLNDRKELTAGGVSEVDSFDDRIVVAHTSLGELTIKGSGLHILRLNTETGDLSMAGHIESLEYAQVHPTKGGVFGRLFR